MIILFFILGIATGFFLWPLMLQYLVKWIAKFKPKYMTALKANSFAWLLSGIIGFVKGCALGFKKGLSEGQSSPVPCVVDYLVIFVISLIVASVVYALIFKDPEKGPISFGKACLIAIVQNAIGIILFIFFVTIILLAKRAGA